MNTVNRIQNGKFLVLFEEKVAYGGRLAALIARPHAPPYDGKGVEIYITSSVIRWRQKFGKTQCLCHLLPPSPQRGEGICSQVIKTINH